MLVATLEEVATTATKELRKFREYEVTHQKMQQGIENLKATQSSRVSVLLNNIESIREEMAEVKSELKVTRAAKENLESDLEAS